MSRSDVAKAILLQMHTAAKKNPKLIERLGYLQDEPGVALTVLEFRLRICDAACPESQTWSAHLNDRRNKRNRARKKYRRRTDEAFRLADNEKQNAWRRQYAKTPEGKAKLAAQSQTYWEKLKADPVRYAAHQERRRKRNRRHRSNPEVREREKQYARDRRAALKKEREASPELDRAYKQNAATRQREYRARIKAEDPERFELWREKERANARRWNENRKRNVRTESSADTDI